jgi:hypothetical protein
MAYNGYSIYDVAGGNVPKGKGEARSVYAVLYAENVRIYQAIRECRIDLNSSKIS